MKSRAYLGALACFGVLSASQLFSQVLTRTNSGFNTPEYFQVTATTSGIPFPGAITSLSAQDVAGAGKIDLLVSGPNPTNDFQPGLITTTLLRNTGNENFQQIIGNNSSYCQPAFQIINNVVGFCALADLNGDGIPDKIFADEFPDPANASQGEVDYPEIKVQLATGPGTYAAPHTYVLGGKAEFISAITTGDFNGDGRTDIAVLLMPQPLGNSNIPPEEVEVPGRLIVLSGKGDGEFTVSHSYTTSTYYDFLPPQPLVYLPALPYLNLVALDLNGDGKSDLIVYTGLAPGRSPTSIYFGTSGGLSVQPGFGGSYFSDLVAGNFQGEGVHDLAAVETDGTVHVLLWGGPNSTYFNFFKHDQQLLLNEYGPIVLGITAADFNRDGRADLVVQTGSFIDIYLQGEDGTFSAPRQYASSLGFCCGSILTPNTGMAVADFNGDGKLDIAVGTNAPLNIYYGDGYGSFTGPAVSSFPRSGSGSFFTTGGIVTADFNRDGHADIAEVNRLSSSNQVGVFLGSGNGSFQPPVNYALSTPNPIIATGDLNGDGIPDLAVINATFPGTVFPPYTGPDTNVLLGQPGGTFAPARGYTLGVYGTDLILRDVNNDGKLDLITDVGVNLGNGNGTFGPLIPFPITPGELGEQIVLGDFNHDGKLDVLYSSNNRYPPTITVLLGDGTGHFTVKQTITPPCALGGGCGSIAVGNLNGDSNPDFVAGATTTFGMGVAAYFGNGDGTFREGFTANLFPRPADAFFLGSVVSLAIQDVNGDGTEDIVVQSPNIVVLLGKGGGTFAAPITFPTNNPGPGSSPSGSATFAFADFNGDGALDVALATGNGFARVLNTGYKTWPKPSSLPTAPPLKTSASTTIAEER